MEDSLEPRRSAAEPASEGGRDAIKAPDPNSGVHNATTRVTIAWPFSQIKLEEASAELSELAGLLSDVIEAMSDVAPSTD
jgi:hypothetical protein